MCSSLTSDSQTDAVAAWDLQIRPIFLTVRTRFKTHFSGSDLWYFIGWTCFVCGVAVAWMTHYYLPGKFGTNFCRYLLRCFRSAARGCGLPLEWLYPNFWLLLSSSFVLWEIGLRFRKTEPRYMCYHFTAFERRNWSCLLYVQYIVVKNSIIIMILLVSARGNGTLFMTNTDVSKQFALAVVLRLNWWVWVTSQCCWLFY